MPSLFKPQIITYRLPDGSYRTPDGQRVNKDTPDAIRSVEKSKKWYGRYTANGKTVRVPLCESKEIAKKMLAKITGDAAMGSVGLIDPFADQRQRPILEHLEDYRRYLIAKGDTKEHADRAFQRIRDIADGCRFKTADDIQASAVVEFLGGLRDQTPEQVELDPRKETYTKAEMVAILGIHHGSVARMLRCAGLDGIGNGKARRYPQAVVQALQEKLSRGAGPTTCNHYLTAIKGFTRWLARDRRMPLDPLSYLSRQNTDVDVRRSRRALVADTFTQLIESTATGSPFRSLTGEDRVMLYLLAVNTGFRAGELASLTPDSFDLDANPPTVTVEAAYSKHRRPDVQPLRGDVAEMMKTYLAGKPKGEPVWPGTWHDRSAEMLRGDLEAAGIPYQDDAGRYFDFHAMRGQFISLLAANGVHPKVAQILARHSTITLTMDFYTHMDVLDVTGALDKLPPVSKKKDESTVPEEVRYRA